MAESGSEVVAIPPGCQLLGVERRGREIAFRFPMSILSSGGQNLLGELQAHTEELNLRTIGLSLTSLEDVFMTATAGGPMTSPDAVEAAAQQDVDLRNGVVEGDAGRHGQENAMYESTSGGMVFLRHFRAMFIKRCCFARRDLMLLIFQVIIPILFLLLSLLINLVRAPSQPSRVLDMSMFPDAPGQVMMSHANSYIDRNAFQISATTPNASVGSGNILDFRTDTSAMSVLNSTLFMSEVYANESHSHEMARYYGFATSGMLFTSGAPNYNSAIFHNISYSHASVMGLSSIYNLARYQVYGDAIPKLQVRNRPMPIGEFEQSMWDANKQVMSGIFVILPFILIPCNTISYIVREKETGARHMQWLSGASVAAYWLSSFVFDFACYVVTEILAMIIFVIFNRTEYIRKENVGVTITLFLFFGFSAVASSYLLSFFFKSSSTAQTVVLLVNFVFGFLWVTLEEMLAIGAYNFTYYVTAIVRILPAVSFGEGLYVLSGQRIANMMFPTRDKPYMYSLLTLTSDARFVGGIGTAMLYMGCVTVGSTIALVVLEYIRLQRAFRGLGDCCAEDTDAKDELASVERDFSVVEEENRVCADETGPASDMIAVQHLHKRYFGSNHAAVCDVSFGVKEGEVMGLLGLNGAGKSTAIGIIAGETMATNGDAYVNHISVLDSASRSYIGYCPQYNPLLDLMSPKEHLWLYARLRGLREELIRDEVNMLIRELGLYPHRHLAAHALSGGNKRRLTLAVALVGRTTSILLDEPTAGMDTLARSQTCTVVKRLTGSKSVVLTTHLLDEVEAMADRVTFMTRGRVSCIGTPQELRGRANRDSAYTIMVTFHHDVDLTGEHSQVPSLVERFVDGVIQGDVKSNSSDSQPGSAAVKKGGAEGEEGAGGASLREGAAPDVPTVDFVSVSQPTLEDILLQDNKE
ncbi:glucosylceramide transporter ABCA12-like [Bactrocera neohumeralis]|uniref:glucosylceramide transporter ABCA12-like n=1 Tax=Bactrocera neohumeralis TaxID=98809 RepID=UPI0021666F64|nr:glucosylceramide transporter ABCA12-like [Bactrocera neohumeralis]